jgi:hypothetical protein
MADQGGGETRQTNGRIVVATAFAAVAVVALFVLAIAGAGRAARHRT